MGTNLLLELLGICRIYLTLKRITRAKGNKAKLVHEVCKIYKSNQNCKEMV